MSLKKNILYSGFLTTSLYVFQFITYPYVARVLGVTNIGICNFVQSIVQYFSLFSMLGISTLGVREIAKCNGDKAKLNATFSQLFTLNLCFTIAVLIVYVTVIETVQSLIPYRKLLYIGATQILFSTFSVEWLFRGLEEFRYITIRTLFVRAAYVVSIFLFVRNSDDYVTYFIIYTGMIVTNGLINWRFGMRFVKYSFQGINAIKQHLKPLLFLGSQLILTSFYTTFNTMFLGLLCGDTQVGYYTTATKIENIILSLYSALTLVMMPRMSAVIEGSDKVGVSRLLNTSFGILTAFVFPCLVFSEFYAEQLVGIVAGPGYEGAIFPMRLVMPVMLIVGLEQIFIVQLLMPGRNDREVFINALIGAICGVGLNLLFVSDMACIGSALSWGLSEFAVLLSAIYYAKKRYPHIKLDIKITRHILCFFPLTLVLMGVLQLNLYSWISFALGLVSTIAYSHVALKYFVRNTAYIEITNFLVARIKKTYKQ